MAEPIDIDVWQGEISELEVDALVVAANESLFMTTGAGASVKRHGGEQIERAAVDQGPIAPGSAVVTPGGTLPAPYVIHAVAVGHDRVADSATLAAAIRAALAFVEPLQVRRIAFTPLGVEHGAFAPADAAALLVSTLLAEAPATPLETIVLASLHPAEVHALAEALHAARAGVRAP
jgi:O-acetyl-ADP-ribose deacetylase (regulator of RNase III)